MLKQRPTSFKDCIEQARHEFETVFVHDIKQLLHVYPLDSKTKEGNLFWSLPKRPPTPLIFDKTSVLHNTFITSMACLRAQIFFVEIPTKEPRSDAFKKECGEIASQVKVIEFIPDDSKAKEI